MGALENMMKKVFGGMPSADKRTEKGLEKDDPTPTATPVSAPANPDNPAGIDFFKSDRKKNPTK